MVHSPLDTAHGILGLHTLGPYRIRYLEVELDVLGTRGKSFCSGLVCERGVNDEARLDVSTRQRQMTRGTAYAPTSSSNLVVDEPQKRLIVEGKGQ